MSLRMFFILIVFVCPFVSASGGHSSGGLLDIQPGLSFWTIVTFVVLLAILKKFAWKPLLESLDAREKNIQEKITTTEKNNELAQKYAQETAQKLGLADGEAKNILQQAGQQAEELHRKKIIQAEQECLSVKLHAQKQIHSLQKKMMEEMLDNVGSISIEIAQKATQQSLSEQDHSRLISDSIRALQNHLK